MAPSSRAAPDRIVWVVDLLDITPDDQILEFGCGSGVAVALVADRLVAGTITAIDRSATAIERARARNAEHIAAGRAVLQHVALADFHGEPGHYTKAFAVNVNVFWTSPADAECQVLSRMLKPGGAIRLVYDGPAPGSGRDVHAAVAANLQRHGFATTVTHGPDNTMVCVTGQVDEQPT